MQVAEEFKDIPEYEGVYQVSNLGNVKSLKNNITLKPIDDGAGYLQVGLYLNGKRRSKRIHKLVAIVFLGHLPDGHNEVIDHEDGNKKNNNKDNLKRTTQRKNIRKRKNKKKPKSGYMGVYLDKVSSKWRTSISIKGKRKTSPRFDTELEAFGWYDMQLNNIKK